MPQATASEAYPYTGLLPPQGYVAEKRFHQVKKNLDSRREALSPPSCQSVSKLHINSVRDGWQTLSSRRQTNGTSRTLTLIVPLDSLYYWEFERAILLPWSFGLRSNTCTVQRGLSLRCSAQWNHVRFQLSCFVNSPLETAGLKDTYRTSNS